MKTNFDVLISYSSKNIEVANNVLGTLENLGIKCWIDYRNIEVGERWSVAIIKALEECKILLLILTNESNNSDEVLSEVENAHRLSKPILLFFIEKTSLSRGLQYFLNSVQWLDASKPNYEVFLPSLGQIISKRLDINRKNVDNQQFNAKQPREVNEVLERGKLAFFRLDYEEAFPHLIEASNMGSGQADYFLGRMYSYGSFVNLNVFKATDYYQNAINKGCSWGYYGLASLEEKNSNRDKARKLYTESFEGIFKDAMASDIQACFMLGLLFHEGFGVNKNIQNSFKWYSIAAEKGHPAAQSNIGSIYLGEKNFEEARYWFELAALKNLGIAQYNLGQMYQYGWGVSVDLLLASKWYIKAAESELDLAQYELGRMYLDGIGVEKNTSQGFEWLKKAAGQGNTGAQRLLGVLFVEGKGIYQDYDQAKFWFHKAAEQGDAHAFSHLGLMYQYGEGVEQNFQQAISYFKKALEAGDNSAAVNLGEVYEQGTGVSKDLNKAFLYYKHASEKGFSNAQNKLAYFYQYGNSIVVQDIQMALFWHNKAADNNHPESLNSLGSFYLQGIGVTVDYSSAMQYFMEASKLGNIYAYYNIGLIYEYGYGVPVNVSTAFFWYEQSALKGNLGGACKIASMYCRGIGTLIDYQLAYKWYLEAAEQNYSEGFEGLANMYQYGLGVQKNLLEAERLYTIASELKNSK